MFPLTQIPDNYLGRGQGKSLTNCPPVFKADFPVGSCRANLTYPGEGEKEFLSAVAGEKGVGGSSQTPWLCSITHESQVPHGGSSDVGQGHNLWAGDVSDFDSQLDSVAKPGVPVGFFGHVSTQQLEMHSQTLPCFQRLLGCASTMVGDPGP